MTDYFYGGEDTSFPYGSGIVIGTQTGYYDSNFSRCLIGTGILGAARSKEFTPLTSFWLGFMMGNNSMTESIVCLGIVKDPNSRAGLYFGIDSSAWYKLAIFKYDGTNFTKLTAESGTSVTRGLHKIDVHMTDYGASSTIDAYVDGSLVISFSGDSSITGVDSFSALALGNKTPDGCGVSEIIVSSTDTRGRRLKTVGVNAAGDVNEFAYGTYSDLNEVTINDATQIYTDLTDKKFLANCTGMPSGDWVVGGMKIEARCADGLGTLGARLGLKSGGTEDYEATPQNCSGYWQTKERLMNVNPITGASFTPAEIEAIQIGVESGTV